MHEAQMNAVNAFVTLTYDDKHIPAGGTLWPAHLAELWRALRHQLGPLRYFACGEYGERTLRPHYHALIFGQDFHADRKKHLELSADRPTWTSKTLDNAWGKGLTHIGELTFASAAYIARYTFKKLNGEPAARAYARVADDGTVYSVTPEFVRMSLKPGIGQTWYNDFKDDVYPHDEVVHRGRRHKPPPYYDKLLERENPELWERVRARRIRAAQANTDAKTPDRLEAKEEIFRSKLRNRRPDKL